MDRSPRGFFLRGGRHGAERATVKRLRERDHFIARLAMGLRAGMAKTAGGFDQAVVRLRAGVREKTLPGSLTWVSTITRASSACCGI